MNRFYYLLFFCLLQFSFVADAQTPRELWIQEQWTNNLSDSRFHKKGAETSLEDCIEFHKIASTEMEKNFAPTLMAAITTFKDRGIHIETFGMRAKEPRSLKAKMDSPLWRNRDLDQITDGIGGRIVVRSLEDVATISHDFSAITGMHFIMENDYIRQENSTTGYRALHLLVKTAGGMIAEIQLKTLNQHLWSMWSHGELDGPEVFEKNLYKNPRFTSDPQILNYLREVSLYLYMRDQGLALPLRPIAPAVLINEDLDFPWAKIY